MRVLSRLSNVSDNNYVTDKGSIGERSEEWIRGLRLSLQRNKYHPQVVYKGKSSVNGEKNRRVSELRE